jgi:hypothetical protein
MALATYADLQTSVAGWTKRADLAGITPDLIALASARINRDFRLGAQITTTTVSAVANAQTVALPADFLEVVSVSIGDRPLEPASEATADAEFGEQSGRPVQYSVRGSELVLWPIPDGVCSLSLTYYTRFSLDAANTTNWLLTNHPGVYLYATLAECEPYLHNDQRAVTWEAKYANERDSLKSADQKARFSGSGIRVVTR